ARDWSFARAASVGPCGASTSTGMTSSWTKRCTRSASARTSASTSKLIAIRLLAVLPGAQILTQLAAPDLAADGLRQFGHEVDLARVLVRRGERAGVLLQLARERVACLVPGRQDDERAHDLRAL